MMCQRLPFDVSRTQESARTPGRRHTASGSGGGGCGDGVEGVARNWAPSLTRQSRALTSAAVPGCFLPFARASAERLSDKSEIYHQRRKAWNANDLRNGKWSCQMATIMVMIKDTDTDPCPVVLK